MASRPASRPWADRRGMASGDLATRACSSTTRGRWPSSVGTTTEPGRRGLAVGQEQAAGVGHPGQAVVGHLEQARARSVGPKRCLTARSRRRAWWRSPSKDRTVSTTCSSTRGPARAPSLVTWPTRTVARLGVLGRPHQPVGALPHLGHRAGRRGQLGVEDGLDGVDDEDVGRRARRRGPGWPTGRSRPPATGSGSSAPRRAARRRTCWADSSAQASRQRGAVAGHGRTGPGGAGWTCRCPARRRAG